MKILESQNAILTNFEVYSFVQDRKNALKAEGRRRGPGNLETLLRELMQYLETAPGPLSQKPTKYSPAAIQELVQILRGYGLTKGEVIMIFNLRPTSHATLFACIEETESRLDEDQQQEILDAVARILGAFPASAEDDPDAIETIENGPP